jgi:hypothetical protein
LFFTFSFSALHEWDSWTAICSTEIYIGVIILAFSAGLGAFVLLEISGRALDGIEGFASAIKRCTFESKQ